MKTDEKINAQLLDLCRLCLKSFSGDKNKNLENIFFNDENISLTMRIMATTAIEIQQGDGLPEKLCNDCRIQLEKSYYFRKKSKNSDTKLRRHIRLMNAGKPSKIDEIDPDEDLDEYKDSLDFFANLEKIEQGVREQLKCKQDAVLQKALQDKFELKMKRVHADYQIEIKNYKLNVIKLKRQLKQQLQVNKEQQESNESIKIRLLKKQKLLKSFRNDKEKWLREYKIKERPMTTNNKLSVKTDNKNNMSINSVHTEQSFIELKKSNNIVGELSDDLIGNDDDDDDEISIIPYEFSDSQTIDGHSIQASTIPRINKYNNDNDCDGNDDGDLDHENEEGNGYSIGEREVNGDNGNYDYKNEHINENDVDSNPLMIVEEYEIEEQVGEHGGYGESKNGIRHVVEENWEEDDEENLVFCLESRENNTDSYILSTSKMKMEYPKSMKEELYTEIDVTTTADGDILDVDLKLRNARISNDKLIPSPAAIFRCTDCTAAFTRYNQLIKHARIHGGDRAGFSCFACLKWFQTQSALLRHERIHTGEKPFICAICERGFVQKEILKRHLATHTGVKPFPCKFCKAGFTQKQVLALHINSVHSKNPVITIHRCELCPKTFRHASGLSRHLIVHTGRAYLCQYCQRKFNDASALKRHVQALHIKKRI